MIYTEEDLKQAYAMGYNEAVDDVNVYIESCNEEEYDNDEEYSAVEAAIMNESNRVKKLQNSWGAQKEWDNLNALKKKIGLARFNKQQKRHYNALKDAVETRNSNAAEKHQFSNYLKPKADDEKPRFKKSLMNRIS